MTSYRLMDGLSGRPGSGPSTGTSYAGNLVVGCAFGVTQGGLWFEGYYWWVPTTNGDTASGQKFALWQCTGTDAGTIVPGSAVTAGALSTGWNFIALTTPLLLSPYAAGTATTYGCAYVATTGKTFTSGFPETKNQFGTGDTYAAGITNGPLTGFSSISGSAPVGGSGGWLPQQPFGTAADPTVAFPTQNDSDANLWLDVQVSDTAPASPTYRAWPNEPAFVGGAPQSLAYTLGLEFTVSQTCTLQRIWHYSPPGVTILPSRCAIWNVGTTAVVPGSDNTSPTWSGAAGSGWVSCDYTGSGVTLASGTSYKVSTFTSDNTHTWFNAQANFWGGSPGPFSSGITAGPLTILGNASASPGQDSWNQGITWTYPATSTNPEFDGIDVEVAPSGSTNISASFGLAMAPLEESFTAAERLSASFALPMAPLKSHFTATETGANISSSFGLGMAPLKMNFSQRSPGGLAVPSDEEARGFKRWLLWEV